MKEIKITSKQPNRYKLYMKDYTAKLGLPTGKYKYDRTFLKRTGHKNKKGNAYFTWNITEAGVYEMREDLEYRVKTSYVVINDNGDILELQTTKEIQGFLTNTNSWETLSNLKLQIFKLRFKGWKPYNHFSKSIS